MTSSHPLWWEDVPAHITRPRISGDLDADVAVVGAGFTGLWTARELLRRDPHLRVVILEAEHVGYGASGRNGGWASALFPVSLDVVSRDYSPEHALTFTRFLHRAVAELGAALDEDLIDADFVQGGTLTVARHEIQAERLRAEERDAHERGLSDDDLRWLPVDELESRVRLRGARGALYSPHCARLHPGKLVHGLARRVEELGAHIYEGSRVTRLLGATPNRRAQVLTTTGRVRADIVVRATEGYTPALGPRRTVVPIYSLMIATEPLDESWWSERGFDQAETFADARHLIIYGQRTADNRLAFGGRGAPYHFGSGVDPRFDHHSNVFASLRETLVDLVGDRGVEVSHQWGGPLAMPRDHYPRAVVHHEQGIVDLGGYTGDGVTMSFVMGRLAAKLLLERRLPDDPEISILTRSPRQWEFEPLRYLGITAGLWLADRADRAEARGHVSRAAQWLEKLW